MIRVSDRQASMLLGCGVQTLERLDLDNGFAGLTRRMLIVLGHRYGGGNGPNHQRDCCNCT